MTRPFEEVAHAEGHRPFAKIRAVEKIVLNADIFGWVSLSRRIVVIL